MSVAASVPSRTLPRDSITPTREPLAFVLYAWSLAAIAATALASGVVLRFGEFRRPVLELALWIGLVAVADLTSIQVWKRVSLGMGLPVLLACAFVYGPIPAALVAFLGSADAREMRREISLSHAVFNRSQVSLSVLAAGYAFAETGGRTGWPILPASALAALAVDFVVNATLTSAAAGLKFGQPWRYVLPPLHVRRLLEFAATYACFGFLAVLLLHAYERVGTWSLAISIVPLVLARQAFVMGKRFDDTVGDLSRRTRALEKITRRIAEERSDERARVAAALHDDVLQAIFMVTLHAQVIREDLRSGQLLQLEEDVPSLLRISESAADLLRRVISGLRTSPIGQGGLPDTLDLLCRQLSDEFRCTVEAVVEAVDGPPLLQLTIYQIAREALVNALLHAGPSRVRVALAQDGEAIRLTIEDDGKGFDPSAVDTAGHMGLELMRERAALLGGILIIESKPSEGTVLAARFPLPRQG